MEVTTREGYTYSIGKHIMPWFGPMRMNQIMPSDVREWVTHLTQTEVSATNIRTLKSILSAVFTTALNDQVTFLHPCKGVKTPTVPPRLLTVVSPEHSTSSTRHSLALMPSCLWRPPSRAACGGGNSPNSGRGT